MVRSQPEEECKKMGKPMTAQRSHKYFYNPHTNTFAAILFEGQRPQTQMKFNYYIWPVLHRFFIRIYLLIYLNIYLLYLLDSYCFIFALCAGYFNAFINHVRFVQSSGKRRVHFTLFTARSWSLEEAVEELEARSVLRVKFHISINFWD